MHNGKQKIEIQMYYAALIALFVVPIVLVVVIVCLCNYNCVHCVCVCVCMLANN